MSLQIFFSVFLHDHHSLHRMNKPVLTLTEIEPELITPLLARYQLHLTITTLNEPIPGSYWGESEAGLIKDRLYVRMDTPIHSLLHEACHYICMDEQRRRQLDTTAEGDYDEENAVCYLQILLADKITGVGSERLMQDMDSWGYTFRLGSAHQWFTRDADDAKQWLINNNLIDTGSELAFHLRQ